MLSNLPLDEHDMQEQVHQKKSGIDILPELISQIKKQPNFLLVQLLNDSAIFKKLRDFNVQTKVDKLLMIGKRQNFIQIKYLSEISERQPKHLKNFLLNQFQKINLDHEVQTLGIKGYFNSADNTAVLESSIKNYYFMDIMQKFETMIRFQKIAHLCLKLMEQLQKNFQDHLIEIEAKLKHQLVKLRQAFEQNRIHREKATKICLLSKNRSNIVNKIVMNYLEDIRNSTLLSRQLYSKYREKKNQIKQGAESIKKLKSIWEKRKSQDSQDDRNEKNKMGSPFVVQPIAMVSQQIKEGMQCGGFGSVAKLKCSFRQLYTFYYQSQILIQKKQDENNQKEEEPFLISQNLVKKSPLNNQYAVLSFQNELESLNCLRHERCPQIAQYYHPVIKVNQERIINEQFVQSKCLYSKYYQTDFTSYQKSSYKTKLKIIQDLAEGIKFLVQSGLVHRDLKPSNIKLTKSKNVKIIDFGSACLQYSRQNLKSFSNRKRRIFCFSPDYTLQFAKAHLSQFAEEEFYRHKFYDMYAFGIITRNYFGLNQGDPRYLVQSLEYLWGKCMQFNPDDRIEPIQILVYLRELLKLISTS